MSYNLFLTKIHKEQYFLPNKLFLGQWSIGDEVQTSNLGNYNYSTEEFTPPCGYDINYEGTVTMTDDILECNQDYMITISSNNVILDCDNKKIEGTGNYGVSVNNSNNVTEYLELADNLMPSVIPRIYTSIPSLFLFNNLCILC